MLFFNRFTATSATPSTDAVAFSTRALHAAHVIPATSNVCFIFTPSQHALADILPFRTRLPSVTATRPLLSGRRNLQGNLYHEAALSFFRQLALYGYMNFLISRMASSTTSTLPARTCSTTHVSIWSCKTISAMRCTADSAAASCTSTSPQ